MECDYQKKQNHQARDVIRSTWCSQMSQTEEGGGCSLRSMAAAAFFTSAIAFGNPVCRADYGVYSWGRAVLISTLSASDSNLTTSDICICVCVEFCMGVGGGESECVREIENHSPCKVTASRTNGRHIT